MAATSERVLYQFPLSHFCEKARWLLDAKGLPYTTQNLLPGIHALVLRARAHTTHVPVLVDRERVIADSSAIALYLDERYPERRLLPVDPVDRARVLELEDWFDREAGASVRRWVYSEWLATPGVTSRVFLAEYGIGPRALGLALGRLFERGLRARYRMTPEKVRASRTQALASLDRLEQLIEGDPQRRLVGKTLTVADITAASLLAPLVNPPESPWPAHKQPRCAALDELRASLRTRPVGQWLLARYQHDRVVRAYA